MAEKNSDLTQQHKEIIFSYKILAEKIKDIIFIISDELEIVFFNKAAAKFYNLNDNDLNKKITEIKILSNLFSINEITKTVIEKGEWENDFFYEKDQTQTIYFNSKWYLIEQDQTKYILIINKDITEKKNLEKQILHAQRMESIGFLAGGIVHEINNLFTPILMSAKYIRKHLSDETSRKMLETIKTSVQRGSELIKQVLIFSRSEERELESIDFNDVIKELKSIIIQTFPKNIKILIDCQPDLWKIKGNFTQLYQVILNLCLNASDAMPEGGKLEINIKNIIIDQRFSRMTDIIAGKYLQVIVSDTGIGIPEHSISKIFDPFFTSKEVGKGTGLGLPTSMTIVKRHGGIIKVYSIFGKGTSFKIYFPVVDNEVTNNIFSDEIKNTPKGDGEIILVVDDEAKILTTIDEILKSNGYNVLKAINGKEAIKSFKKEHEKISLVLTDIQMPYLDGYEVYDKIRELNKDVPIILSSGLISAKEIKNSKDEEISFLIKPYTEEKLLKTIALALGKKG